MSESEPNASGPAAKRRRRRAGDVLLSNVYFADSRWNREHHQTTHATGTTSLPASYSTVSSGIQAGLITSQLRTSQVLQGALA